jgi:hypothetical protein
MPSIRLHGFMNFWQAAREVVQHFAVKSSYNPFIGAAEQGMAYAKPSNGNSSMGMIQFTLPDFDRLPERALDLAYLSNHDDIPVVTNVARRNNLITASRVDSESCTFTIPWRTEAYGEVAVTTGTLLERAEPYLLPVELARGTLYRVRMLSFLWSLIGLSLPAEFEGILRKATRRFAKAATVQEDIDRAATAGVDALEGALDATRILSRAYGEQAVAARRQVDARPPILVGARLDDRAPTWPFTELLLHACNTVQSPFAWPALSNNAGEYAWETSDAQLAWAAAHGLRICGGPLVCFDKGGMPESVAGECDFAALHDRVVDHVHRVVERYRGRVHLWHALASPNASGGLAINEEQRVRLAVHVIEAVRNTDPRTPVVVSFKQPWGEYLRHETCELSPLHFADVLCRADLGLSGLGLEIDFRMRRETTIPREPLDVSRQIDRWTQLNLPLMLMVSRPTACLIGESAEIAGDTPASQGCEIERWFAEFGPVMFGKPAVQAILWSTLCDRPDQGVEESGLYDAEGKPKAALKSLARLKRLL